MNAKRQTIWLVSMLSLMVVLSAYYLFTEDVNKLDLASTDSIKKNPQEVKIDMSQTDKASAVTETAKKDDKTTADQTAKAAAKTDAKTNTTIDAKTDATTGSTTDAKTDPKTAASSTSTSKDIAKQSDTPAADKQILQQVEAQAQTVSASDYFTNEQMKNKELLRKKSDQLLVTITDPKQKPEAVVKATNELSTISDEQEKIDNLEGLLTKDFPQAIVSQDGGKWKVTVQSDKLEKSQAVSIVDLVIKELNAAPENIKIQYVRP
jgi:stage III sporulation protein AH